MSLKIAMIQRFLPGASRGGVGYFAHRLGNALAARGHSLTVFSQDPAPQGARYRVLTLPRLRSRFGSRLAALQFPFQLAKIRFPGFDIIHAHGDDHFIARRSAPPVVRTMHGSALAEAFHNGVRLASPKRCLMHLLFYAGEMISDLRADAVIADAEETRRYYPKIHAVIPGGVDAEFFCDDFSKKTPHPTILFVGELHTRKRGRLLVDLFQTWIKPRMPSSELWLVCPEQAQGPGIRWWGTVDSERLIELYRQAWVFCLPSSYEGFGLPYLEALAAGTAVVATPNPGARELLANGRYGFLTPARQLGKTLLAVLKDDSLRKEYGRSGYRHAQKYLWSKIAERYEQVYNAVIENRKTHGRSS